MCMSGSCARRSTLSTDLHSYAQSAARVTYSMRFSELRRTTTFRLTILYGALFAVGTIALLWMIYVRSVVYMTARVDQIINIQADALLPTPRPGLRQPLI